MPKKKKVKKSSLNHFIFRTRKGFYSLTVACAILMFSAIKMYSVPEQGVLGKETERQEAKEVKNEEKREERKEEIRQELKTEPEKVKLKFESKNGNTERKFKIETQENEEEIEVESEALETKVEEEFEDESATEIASDSSSVTITKNKVKARSGFPLSIDLASNQLIITRPDGTTKAVAVLPDKAVQNFMTHKKVNLLNVQDPDTGTDSAETTPDPDASSSATTEDETQISLVEKDDQLVYEIKGKKKLKVLGFIPVNAATTGYVSAETGEVLNEEEPILTRLLNLISL